MKLGVLFSGGKDSTLATLIAKRKGYKISCLISLVSENKESYMFHTPSISKTKMQSKAMKIPLIIGKTKGENSSHNCDASHCHFRGVPKEYICLGSVYFR